MCSRTMELLKEIKLRNKHVVYGDGQDFRVVSSKERGIEHAQSIPSQNVERLAQLARGMIVTVPQAVSLFSAYCSDLDLPYTHGYKFQYHVQEMLLVLVATGRATMSKKGRGYVYHIAE